MFFAKLEEKGKDVTSLGHRMYDWLTARGCSITWGSGAVYGTYSARLPLADGSQHYLAQCWTNGDIAIPFYYKTTGTFAEPKLSEELRRRINSIEGVRLDE